MTILVGYSGFVGSNLCQNMKFDRYYNSKNISKAYGLEPDIMIYAGVRGTKFMANSFPEEDKKNIQNAINNIRKINAKKVILISTVDVYDDLDNKNEDYVNDINKLCVYGKNRLILENWVRENIDDYHIIRIPALYGDNLKKNFIHDLIEPVPLYLNPILKEKIEKEFEKISEYYYETNGMFKLYKKDDDLISFFSESMYNAIYYTDSRAAYQFFNLKKLSNIVFKVIENDIKLFNVVTEPIFAYEIYSEIFKDKFENYICDNPIKYNLKSKYGYVECKAVTINDLKKFIISNKTTIK